MGEKAINESNYLSQENNRNLRIHQIKWNLAVQIDLMILKKTCPQGYGTFAKELIAIAQQFSRKEISFCGD